MNDTNWIYEVWSPLTKPNRFLALTEILDKKLELVAQYHSQLLCKDYRQLVTDLAVYRGVNERIPYAEAYATEEPVRWIVRAYRKLPYSVRNLIHKLRRT